MSPRALLRPHPDPAVCALVSGGLDSAVLLRRLLSRRLTVFPLYLRCGLSWEAVELYWLRRFLRAIRCPSLASLDVIEAPLRSTYGVRSTSLRTPSRAQSRDGAHWSLTGQRVPGAGSADRAVFLPGRNVFLLSHAAVRCAQRGLSTVALGTLRGNPFGDASPRFFRTFASCLTQALAHPIRILAPLRRATKREAIRASAGLPLHLTFSCLSPRGRRHCGACNKCAERRRAFRAAGVPDPAPYAR